MTEVNNDSDRKLTFKCCSCGVELKLIDASELYPDGVRFESWGCEECRQPTSMLFVKSRIVGMKRVPLTPEGEMVVGYQVPDDQAWCLDCADLNGVTQHTNRPIIESGPNVRNNHSPSNV